MAYEVIILGHLHMPLYFLGTFTEYPWIKTSRMHMLNIYTGNRAYENVFKAGAD